MKITYTHWLLSIASALVGTVLVLIGIRQELDTVWISGGAFFVTLALGSIVLALAWILPGRFGAFLRRPVVGVAVLGVVLLMLMVTVVFGIMAWLGFDT